ncbi:uncharacterized protein LOC124420097 isoform X2 [Lucilia cuprina]|uniref:uncharacterized protein LOC124420097 isoform X2 n=1 Tax=Lucilia cuprina TaxID=7375 RepID=UPI001F059B84|nr:uncharacterized protein LOC124420097 isoform X2 [Lucilia cuprina]
MSASNETSKKKHNYSWETEDWAQGTIPVTTNSKIMDIKIAIFTARHSSISSVDHLTNMLKSFP